MANDLADTTRLMGRFEQKQATDRKTLIALLRRNANLIKDLRVQFKASESPPTNLAVRKRF
jgi:hypothetical protein